MKQILLISTSIMFFCAGIIITDSKTLSAQNNHELSTSNISESTTAPADSSLYAESCVIFLFPDSTEIEKMKAEFGEDDFNEIMADMTWYSSLAADALDTLNIKYFDCDEEVIRLKNSKNQELQYLRKEIEGNMILFNIDKEPIFKYAVNFDKDETLRYFDRDETLRYFDEH